MEFPSRPKDGTLSSRLVSAYDELWKRRDAFKPAFSDLGDRIKDSTLLSSLKLLKRTRYIHISLGILF